MSGEVVAQVRCLPFGREWRQPDATPAQRTSVLRAQYLVGKYPQQFEMRLLRVMSDDEVKAWKKTNGHD